MNRLLAVAIDLPATDGTTVGSNFPTFGSLVSKFLYLSGILGGIVFVFMLVVAGFQYMSAAGATDAKKMAKAQNSMVTAVAGFLIIVFVYFIIQIIQKITGLKILNTG